MTDIDDLDHVDHTIEMGELILATLAYERGSDNVHITLDRVEAAHRSYDKRYPEGFHAHYELDQRSGFVEFSVSDARTCTFRHEPGSLVGKLDVEDAISGRSVVQRVERLAIANGGYFQRGDTPAKSPSEMSREELYNVAMAQHVALASLLYKTGDVAVSVSLEDYHAAMQKAGPFGSGALMVVKNKDGVHVSFSSILTGEGRA